MKKQILIAVQELKDENFYETFVQRDKNIKSGIDYLFEEQENRKTSFYSVLKSLSLCSISSISEHR